MWYTADKLAMRVLVSSGEPLQEQLLWQLQDALPVKAAVLNIYGSTEVSADATCFCVSLLPRKPLYPLQSCSRSQSSVWQACVFSPRTFCAQHQKSFKLCCASPAKPLPTTTTKATMQNVQQAEEARYVTLNQSPKGVVCVQGQEWRVLQGRRQSSARLAQRAMCLLECPSTTQQYSCFLGARLGNKCPENGPPVRTGRSNLPGGGTWGRSALLALVSQGATWGEATTC